jgi:hypothetical protein
MFSAGIIRRYLVIALVIFFIGHSIAAPLEKRQSYRDDEDIPSLGESFSQLGKSFKNSFSELGNSISNGIKEVARIPKTFAHKLKNGAKKVVHGIAATLAKGVNKVARKLDRYGPNRYPRYEYYPQTQPYGQMNQEFNPYPYPYYYQK